MEVCSDGERDHVLLLLLHCPVAFNCESCLLRLTTSAFSFPTSVVCGVATVAMDGEITSITLSAISANSSSLLLLAVDARIILTLLGSRWIKSPLRRDRSMASASSPSNCCIFRSSQVGFWSPRSSALSNYCNCRCSEIVVLLMRVSLSTS